MLEKLEEKILNKIKNEHLAPKPRWRFLLKEWLVWLFGFLSLLVGAAAVATMIYLAPGNDWLMSASAENSFAAWIVLSLPYFWLFFLGLFVALLYFNIKRTKRGYRYPAHLIVLAAILVSIILGVIFSALGVGEKIDNLLGRRAPFYDLVFNPRIDAWSRPEDGRLAGLVVSRLDESNFILADRERGEWQIIYSGDDEELIIVGQLLRAIGKISGEKTFMARKIMAMKPGREFFKRLNPGMMPPPPMLEFHANDKNCAGGQNNHFRDFFIKYPELKSSFEASLLANEDLLQDIKEGDRYFLPILQELNLSDAVKKKLFTE